MPAPPTAATTKSAIRSPANWWRGCPTPGPLDAVAAVGAAAAAFKEWSKTPPSKRRAILWKAADLLEARAQEVAKTITAETGGTFGWGMFNTFFAAT